MDHAAVRQDGHRPHHLGHEAVDLGGRHQPGEVGLRFQERLAAVGHQVIHVGDGLHRDGFQSLPQFLALPFVFGELAGDGLLGAGLDVRVGEQAGEVADEPVRFRDLALEPGGLAAIRFQRFAGHRGDFIQHAVHVVEDGAHRRLHTFHQLVLADRCPVVARFRPVRLPVPAGVVAVRALGVAALAGVEDIAAAGAEQVSGERPHFLRLARPVGPIGRELRLGTLEGLIVDDAQRLVAVDDVVILVRPARHATAGAAVELEAAAQVANLADEHGVGQDAADGPEAPRPAEPRRHAARPYAPGDFLQADRLGQVHVEDEAHGLGFLFVNGQTLLAVVAFNDAIAVGRRPAGPTALLVPLHKSGPRALGEHAAVVGGDDKLHAAGERVGALGDAHDFDAVLFEVFDEHVRLGGAAETVVLVHVELADVPGLGFLHETQQFCPPARGASGLGLVDEVSEFPAGGAFARFDLHGDARAVVLCVTGVAGVERVVLTPGVTVPSV